MSTVESARVEQALCDASRGDEATRRPLYARYLFWLLVIPALVYCATFPLLMNPHLPHLGFSKFGPVLDYSFNIQQKNADVVIYGDSSAFIGVDPRIVNQQTGLSTVVLPNTVGSLPVTGDIPLRHYLRNNRRPRLIVLYFSPWSLDFNHTQRMGANFEGDEEVLRNGTAGERLHYFLHRPAEFLSAPFRAYITFNIANAIAYFRSPDREGQTAAALGHMDYTLPYPAVKSPCKLSETYLSRVNDESVLQMARTFQQMQIPVAVYLAPIPQCAGAAVVANRSYAELHASAPAVEPPSWFADDTYFAHVRPERVQNTSALFAATLRSWMSQGEHAR